MIAIGRIATILLCAGLSRRFGSSDKLLQPLVGRPLVDHAARTVMSLPFGYAIAVVSPNQPQLRQLLAKRGLSIVVNDCPEEGQDQSLRHGLAAVAERDIDAIMICLGDMPNVPQSHLRALAAGADEHSPAASLGNGWRSPPVLFPRRFFAALMVSSPRELLAGAAGLALVEAPPGALDDFDTRGDFERASAAGASWDELSRFADQ